MTEGRDFNFSAVDTITIKKPLYLPNSDIRFVTDSDCSGDGGLVISSTANVTGGSVLFEGGTITLGGVFSAQSS